MFYIKKSGPSQLYNNMKSTSVPKFPRIHTALVARITDLSLADDDELPSNAAELNNFHEVSQEDIKEIAYKPLSKSGCLDPLPALVLKCYFPALLPTTTRMVHLSVTTGLMPDALKIASLSPTLKKLTSSTDETC